MNTPKAILDELDSAKQSLVKAIERLEVEGRTYANKRKEYKQKLAVSKATYSLEMSAAKAELKAEGDFSELLGDYEFYKIMHETNKEVMKARTTVCNVLQTEFNAVKAEWAVTT